ncbi:hypothetical protein AB0H28_28875 [Micromonospora sp. NPDC050980]|uniref:hypothetical protein n=1 Tax=Micromonospora sp. NPDC050980 TaxID=3155161 RepID=UPI0033E266BA
MVDTARPVARRARKLAALTLAAAAVVTFQAAPAVAYPIKKTVSTPDCAFGVDGIFHCIRYSTSWSTNSSDPMVFGSLGAYQRMTVYYVPRVSSPYETQVDAFSQVWDKRGSTRVDRMRLTETYKALSAGGGTLSVGWGVLSWTPSQDGVQVSSDMVFFDMTRSSATSLTSISSNRSMAFPHSSLAAKVEQVSNSTIEYPTSNTQFRLLSQIPLKDF